jgi:uncharacterized protein YecE (DUF72 family)
MPARIRTGVTAWADRSLTATGWYPPHANTPETRLRYYASQFSLVENDSAYWALPDRDQVERWAERTPDDFIMNMKAHALLTGHYTDAKRLPAELRAALPPSLRTAPRVYPRHLGAELMEEIAARFYDALAPLHERGKLGVVLFQFPVWFPISRENQRELLRVRRRFSPYRVSVELRNATWLSERNRFDTLELFAAAGIAYVCVDEPQGFVSSVPPIAAATSELAVVRMHGRNASRWRHGARTAAERFDYLYTLDELHEWVPKILDLARRAREVHLLLNNCHADYAVRNARQLGELLAAEEAAFAPTLSS